jgi:RNA polymerase sigma-70 factor (ECF subfamily)
MEDGDHDLIAAAQRGQRSAIDTFVRRHDRWVRNVVYATVSNPVVVDDIVQNVWAKVWEQIGTLIEPARWRGWLYRLARNTAIDAGQKIAGERRRSLTYATVEQAEARAADPAGRLIDAEEHARVLGAIRGLPAIYREPFVLRHLEGWSYSQIGEAMSLPVDTVETRLVRARRLLRSALRDTGSPRKAACNEQ